MKTQHDGDCTVYSSLINETPESGICTCGYGWQQLRKGYGYDHLYSGELQKKLGLDKEPDPKLVELINNAFEENKNEKTNHKCPTESEQRKQITDLLEKNYIQYKRTSEIDK